MSKLIKGYIAKAETAPPAKKVAFSQKQAQIMERHVAARERLTRPVGQPSKTKVKRLYEDFDYQAATWDQPHQSLARRD